MQRYKRYEVLLREAVKKVGEPLYSSNKVNLMLAYLYRGIRSIPTSRGIEDYAGEHGLSIDARFLGIKPGNGRARVFIRKSSLEVLASGLGIPTSLESFGEAAESLGIHF